MQDNTLYSTHDAALSLLTRHESSVQSWKEIEAREMRDLIYKELDGATANVFRLEQSWTRLGIMLSMFKAQEHWRVCGYTTLDDFMNELKSKYNRGRTQLYSYLGVAESLLPLISAEKLEEMGISKAQELRRATKKLEGKPLPPAIIDAALDPTKTTNELRGDIGKALNITEDEKGTWFDLNGFFMSAEERAEFKEAFLATEGILGLTKTMPDHIRRKKVIFAWLQEWYGTHAPEFYGTTDTTEYSGAVLVNTRPAVVVPSVGDATGCGENEDVV